MRPITTSLALLALCAAAAPCPAQTDPAAPAAPAEDAADTACGYALSPSVIGLWRDLGGESGRLGCPTSRESASPVSPQGSASRQTLFGLKGEIVLHTGGPRAGQAFAVTGCAYRLHIQFSGAGGWLGLPIEDAENTADGRRQAFEGGVITWSRSIDECDAAPNRPATAAPAAATADEGPLDIYENAATGDRQSLAAGRSAEIAAAAGYVRLRAQARVFTAQAPGEVVLELFENEARGQHETVASEQSRREALDLGFTAAGPQGFVRPEPYAGAVALKLYRQPGGGLARLTAGGKDEAEASAAGYAFVRIEGYADPAP